jgi:hypothetical protein
MSGDQLGHPPVQSTTGVYHFFLFCFFLFSCNSPMPFLFSAVSVFCSQAVAMTLGVRDNAATVGYDV